jgi:hypothetical protein
MLYSMCAVNKFIILCAFKLLTHKGRCFSVRHVVINVIWPQYVYTSYSRRLFLSENLHCTLEGDTIVIFVNLFPSINLQTSSNIRNSTECTIVCIFVTRCLLLVYEKEVGLFTIL